MGTNENIVSKEDNNRAQGLVINSNETKKKDKRKTTEKISKKEKGNIIYRSW